MLSGSDFTDFQKDPESWLNSTVFEVHEIYLFAKKYIACCMVDELASTGEINKTVQTLASQASLSDTG